MSAAGSSAAAWAAQARAQRPATRWGRLLHTLRLNRRYRATQEALARAREAGAAGERATGELLLPLHREGWVILADRAITGSKANLDHVLVPPCGALLVMVDSKMWSPRRGPVRASGGRLFRGDVDWHRTIETQSWEVSMVWQAMGGKVPLLAVTCVHLARVDGGQFGLNGIQVVEADRLLELLRTENAARPHDPARAARLAQRAAIQLPPYVPGAAG